MQVSLIIPVYNTERWLRRCLDSVLAQTFREFECILVDDGSTDGSAAILDEYTNRASAANQSLTPNQAKRLTPNPTFRVFHEKNRGSSLARQFGIQQAQGEWLVFMDSDDDVHPEYIQRLYDAVTSTHLQIAACDMRKVDENETLFDENENSLTPNRASATNQAKRLTPEKLHERFFSYDFWGFWGKIYSKDLFRDVYFPEWNINEDYVVMAQLFARQEAIAYVPAAMYYYRNNGEGQSNVKLTPRVMDEFRNKAWVTEFYERNEKLRNLETQKLRNLETQKLRNSCAKHARLLQAETAIKLCHIIKAEDKNHQYIHELNELKTFLRQNLWFLLGSPRFLLGLKKEAIKIACFY